MHTGQCLGVNFSQTLRTRSRCATCCATWHRNMQTSFLLLPKGSFHPEKALFSALQRREVGKRVKQTSSRRAVQAKPALHWISREEDILQPDIGGSVFGWLPPRHPEADVLCTLSCSQVGKRQNTLLTGHLLTLMMCRPQKNSWHFHREWEKTPVGLAKPFFLLT